MKNVIRGHQCESEQQRHKINCRAIKYLRKNEKYLLTESLAFDRATINETWLSA